MHEESTGVSNAAARLTTTLLSTAVLTICSSDMLAQLTCLEPVALRVSEKRKTRTGEEKMR